MKKNLTVAIDINPLATHLKRKRGIGQSTFRLAKELISTPLPFKLVFYCLGSGPLSRLLPWADIRHVPDRHSLPEILEKDGIDLIHFSDYFFPLYLPDHFTNGRYQFLHTVITVYDLIPVYFFDQKNKRAELLTRNLLAVLKHFDKIRANSIDTKTRLVQFTGINRNKIRVIYHGLDHSLYHKNYTEREIASVRYLYGLKKGFILQVAAFDWRKNQITLLKAYKNLLDYWSIPLDLVFTGGTPGNELLSFISENNLEDRVKFLGLVPETHLPLIYNAAEIFAFPSYYEGFGNPPLEAMACGLPVVSSNRGSLPEILGNCAMYVDPDNEIDLANAIYTVYSRPEVKADMVKKGLLHAKKYTWKNTVFDLADFYSGILSEGRRV